MRIPSSDLETILDAEKTAILAGDFDQLQDFSERKRALLNSNPDIADKTTLREKLVRNSRLLEAASNGIRAALSNIAALKDARNLSTYAADGTLHKEASATNRLERKA